MPSTRNTKSSGATANILTQEDSIIETTDATTKTNKKTRSKTNNDPINTTSDDLVETPKRTTAPKKPACNDPFDDEDAEISVYSNNISEDSQADGEDDLSTYSYVYWDGTLPKAQHPIAQAMAATTVTKQLLQTDKIFTFLLDDFTNKERLNTSSTLQPFIVHIPGTGQLRVIYGLASALGINGIEESEIEEKDFLALQGESITNKTLPTPIQLPYDILNGKKVKTPTQEDITNIEGDTKHNKKA